MVDTNWYSECNLLEGWEPDEEGPELGDVKLSGRPGLARRWTVWVEEVDK